MDVVELRRRDGPRGAGRWLRWFRIGVCSRERGGREPLQLPAVRRRRSRSRSSGRRPPAQPSRVRTSPRFLAHDRPPRTRWYQGGATGQHACSGKSWARRRDGARRPGTARTRSTALVEPLARRPQRGEAARTRSATLAEPLACRPRCGGAARTRNTTLAEPLANRSRWKPLGRGAQRSLSRSDEEYSIVRDRSHEVYN